MDLLFLATVAVEVFAFVGGAVHGLFFKHVAALRNCELGGLAFADADVANVKVDLALCAGCARSSVGAGRGHFAIFLTVN